MRTRIVEIRRSPKFQLRQGISRMRKHFPVANLTGLGDILAQGEAVPTDGTSSLWMAAHARCAGSQAERVVMELLDRIRLSRAPHKGYRHLLGRNVTSMHRAVASFNKVIKETDDPMVPALATEREFIYAALRVFFTSHVPLVRGARPPGM